MRSIAEILADVRKVAKIYPAGSGHFVYSGGMHGDGYIDYRPLKEKQHAALLREVSAALLQQAVNQAGLDRNRKIAVVGPQTMGALMVNAIGSACITGMINDFANIGTRSLLKDPDKEDAFVWSHDPSMVLDGAQIIWVDDLLNTGKTAAISRRMLEQFDATIDVVATIGDRCNVTAGKLGVRSLVSLEEHPGFKVQHPDTCTLCASSTPIVLHPGHGHDFQNKHVAHPGGFIESPT